MDNFINMNDRVKEKYEVFISTKSEADDMYSIINEYLTNFNYEKISQIEDLDNVIVVIRKK